MKLNLTRPLRTLDGRTIRQSIEGEEVILTLGGVLTHSLLAQNAESGQKVKDFDLAQRLRGEEMNGGEIELELDLVTHCKTCAAEAFGTLVYGQIHHILEKSASGEAVEDALSE